MVSLIFMFPSQVLVTKVESILDFFNEDVEENSRKFPETWTGDDKQVAGALHDSGRRSRVLKWKR